MEFLNESERDKFLKMSPNRKIQWLKEYSLGLERGEALTEVHKILFQLEHDEREYSSLEPCHLNKPELYDVLINDIKESDLRLIGEEVGIARLSIADSVAPFPIRGIIYGDSQRIFIPLVITKRLIKIHVLFLIDTGSPNTYLREDTLKALGFTDETPSNTLVNINKVGLTVHLARGHFDNVDLIGQDFFLSLGALLTVNYKTKEVIVTEV